MFCAFKPLQKFFVVFLGILFNMVFVFYGTAEDIKDNVNNVGVDNSNTNNGNNKKNGGDQQNDGEFSNLFQAHVIKNSE